VSRNAARAIASLALALLALLASPARADEGVFARVTVASLEVRSGPGRDFRHVYTAQRGETFPVAGRAAHGFWLRVELPDATHGFVRGDAVHTYVITGEQPTDDWPWPFARPALPRADGEISLVAGALGSGGLFGARVGYLVRPSFGLELDAAMAVASAGRLALLTAGPIVNLFPSSPLGLFVTLHGGLAASSPNADTFLLTRGAIAALAGGGGVRIGLDYGLTLRLEVRSYAFFEPDRYVTREEFSAGLSVFF
jgi:hypothetical protein